MRFSVCGSRSVLKKVCEVKGTRSSCKRGAEELHQLVGKLKYLWKELSVWRTRASDPEMIQKRMEQDVVLSLLVSLNSSYGQLIMQVLKDGERVDVDGLCELVQSSYKVYEKNKRLIRIRDGTRCKKGRLRRLSRTWVMVRRTRRESRQSGYFENDMETRLIEEFAQDRKSVV